MSSQQFSRLLREEFAERQNRNAAYSLRAFAKTLGCSPGALSQILAGKRPLTLKSAVKMAQALNLPPARRRALLEAVSEGASLKPDPDVLRLEEDRFALIGDWQHFAILSLLDLTEAKDDPVWIAERLGITATQARQALQRLQRLGIVGKSRGRLRQTTKSLSVFSDVGHAAIRRYHSQILQKAQHALEEQGVHEREVGASTLAIDSSKLPEFKDCVRRFRKELAELARAGRGKDRVYVFSTLFFALDRAEKVAITKESL